MLEVQNVSKLAVETVLGKIADAGKSRQTTRVALIVMRELLNEAVENDFIAKNPARKVQLPNCAAPKETRPLTPEEVRRLFEQTSDRDYLIWRVLLLCGLRIGECIALAKDDIRPDGLMVDESAFEGQAAGTKSKKRRLVPLPGALRTEFEDWMRTTPGKLLFPSSEGTLLDRNGEGIPPMLRHARKVASIPDLTFRACRTTFATLYHGDPRDLQAALGHADLALTMAVYRKPIADRQQAAADEMEARLSGKVVSISGRQSSKGVQTATKTG